LKISNFERNEHTNLIPEAPLIALTLERSSTKPLFEQVYETLRQRIIEGRIRVGTRLPASRRFAEELGISRTTIVTAYEQLVAEGYAEGRGGSGFYVNTIGDLELAPSKNTPALEDDYRAGQAHTARVHVQPGQPDMRLFPYKRWAQCVARVARSAPEAVIVTDDIFGDMRLRQAIARHLAEWRGVQVAPRQIVMTAGSGDALEICIRTLIERGQGIALENPGYPPLRNFASSLGVIPHWLDVGPDGAELPDARKTQDPPKLAVLTPSHQFPLGGAMPANRRMEFLRWARNTDSWIVEDDYDSEFRYAGRPIPALASFDRSDRTIYVGSFAKIFSSGLRLGFLVAPVPLIPKILRTLTEFGTKASIAPQRALALFMEEGELYRHIRRVRRVYGERRRILLELMRTELAHLAVFEDHQAGMQIVARLPNGFDDVSISEAVSHRGVLAPSLSKFYAGAHVSSGLILGFCAFTAAEMTQRIAVVRECIEQYRPSSTGSPASTGRVPRGR